MLLQVVLQFDPFQRETEIALGNVAYTLRRLEELGVLRFLGRPREADVWWYLN